LINGREAGELMESLKNKEWEKSHDFKDRPQEEQKIIY
jgi:hypothetical protein